MGGFLVAGLLNVVAICDVDSRAVEKTIADVSELQAETPGGLVDFRRALDDPAIDALVIAAPDHGGGYGKACVFAPEPTREAILDAIRAVPELILALIVFIPLSITGIDFSMFSEGLAAFGVAASSSTVIW